MKNKKIFVFYFLLTSIGVSSALGIYLLNHIATLLIGIIVSWSSQQYFKDKSYAFFQSAFKNYTKYYYYLIITVVLIYLYVNFSIDKVYMIGIMLLYILNGGLLLWYSIKVLYDLYYFIRNFKYL